jgi:RNA exonuclease 4
MDCEMVGVGSRTIRNALARVSIVDYDGNILLDQFVKPVEKVVDYRTEITGIRPEHLEKGKYSMRFFY